MWKIAKYVVYDIIRNKIIVSYTIFLLAICISLFLMDADASRSLSSVMSILLIVVPLISIIFSTIFFYNSYEFIELLVAQPLKRSDILLANFSGVAISLIMAFLIGVAIPVIIYAPTPAGIAVIITGIALSLIFASLAFLAAVSTRDKARGIGMSLLLWFYFSVLYDGLILAFLFFFSDYPLEKPMLFITALNPVDLARICIMLKMDISALMGYTSALYRNFFSTGAGTAYTLSLMALWIIVPLFMAVRIFRKKNL